MSNVPAIIAAEADLARRVRKGTTEPLLQSIAEHATLLANHQAVLNEHGSRLTVAEAAILANTNRLVSLETVTGELTRATVTNESQFAAAWNRAEIIKIRGTVILAGQYTNTIPTRIDFEPGAKIVFTSASYCINMAASLTIAHGRIEGLTAAAGYFINIGGTARAGANAWLRLLHCWFEAMGNVVTMTGSGSSPLGPRTVIYDCDFKSIGSTLFTGLGQEGCIYMGWHCGYTLIDSCRFHAGIHGNPIYLGQSGIPGVHTLGEALFITRNHMVDFHRNGIETFSAAKAFVLGNYVAGGDGSFTGTPSGSGIGISLAGGDSVAAGNVVENVWGYGVEIYRARNTVVWNTVNGIQLDSSNPGVGMSIDSCSDTLLANNRLLNIQHFNHPRYAMVFVNSHDIIARNNYFHEVAYAIWGNSGCEALTLRDNDMQVDIDPAAPALGYVPMAASLFSGTKIKLLNNLCTVGPNLGATITPTGKQNLFAFYVGTGGYADWTATLLGPMGAVTGVGNASSNMVV